MKTYYTFPETEFPPVVLAILERVRLFICTLLYPDEAYTSSRNRFMLTDISPNMALRKSIKYLNLSNATFPFTAYSVGEEEPDTERENSKAKAKKYYSSSLSGKIHAYSLKLELPMISFFSTAKDYYRARTILQEEDALPTKLTVPITINDVLDSFVITVNFTISKGSYAFEFEQQLIQGNIYDLVHTVEVFYHQLVFDGNVAPVDDILFALELLETPQSPNPFYFSSGISSPPTPVVSSMDPADEETNVDVDTNIIFNFNVPMDEESVEDSFDIYPYINADFIWNSTSTQLVVDILTPLVSGTTYEGSIVDDAESTAEVPFAEDFDFSFITEG